MKKPPKREKYIIYFLRFVNVVVVYKYGGGAVDVAIENKKQFGGYLNLLYYYYK